MHIVRNKSSAVNMNSAVLNNPEMSYLPLGINKWAKYSACMHVYCKCVCVSGSLHTPCGVMATFRHETPKLQQRYISVKSG